MHMVYRTKSITIGYVKIRAAVYKQASTALVPSEDNTLPAVSFAEIPAKDVMSCDEQTAVIFKTKKSTIEIPTNIPESLMIKLVKAVSHAL